jgi:DNA polymerase-3 subunit alpha
MAANMTQDMSNTDKLAMTRQELVKMKITLLPPDINKSIPRFSVESLPDGTKAIRYALAGLKGVGEAAMLSVVAERDKNGPFKDLYDFARRLDSRTINKRQMESLAQAGAFDRMNPHRAQVLAASEILLKYAAACAAERSSGQASLFGGAQQELPAPELPKAEKWEPLEYLRHEFEAVGFYLSSHPLDNMTSQLERLRVVLSSKVAEALQNSPASRLRMAGIVIRKQERTSQKGNRFAFVQVSDPFGVYEVMVFSELLAQSRELLEAGTPILLSVDADRKSEDEIRFLAQTIEPLTPAVQNVTRKLDIHVSELEAIGKIKTVLERVGQGRVKVSLMVDAAGHEAEIELPGGWNIAESVPKSLRAIAGVREVSEV